METNAKIRNSCIVGEHFEKVNADYWIRHLEKCRVCGTKMYKMLKKWEKR